MVLSTPSANSYSTATPSKKAATCLLPFEEKFTGAAVSKSSSSATIVSSKMASSSVAEGPSAPGAESHGCCPSGDHCMKRL